MPRRQRTCRYAVPLRAVTKKALMLMVMMMMMMMIIIIAVQIK